MLCTAPHIQSNKIKIEILKTKNKKVTECEYVYHTIRSLLNDNYLTIYVLILRL